MVTRYDDIVDIEKNKHVFINSDKDKGGYRPNIPADRSIIGTDDPLHVARRNLVSRRFTPRAVSQWDDEVRDTVDALLDPVLKRGRGEIVAELAAPLPAQMIGLLLGFPAEMWPKLQHWSETTIALGGGPRRTRAAPAPARRRAPPGPSFRRGERARERVGRQTESRRGTGG